MMLKNLSRGHYVVDNNKMRTIFEQKIEFANGILSAMAQIEGEL